MAVTIFDIADRAGVKRATVSAVLTGKADGLRIAKATQERVRRAARELKYQPSVSARALARGRTFSFGLIYGDIMNPHSAEIATIALAEAEARNYQLLISLTEWKNQERDLCCFDTLRARGVDGIIMGSFAVRPGTLQYDAVLRDKFPLVLFREAVEGLSDVSSDWTAGMEQAVAYLNSKGHTRIAFEDTDSKQVYHDKNLALHAACRKYNVQTVPFELTRDVEQARRIAVDLARRPDRPSALVASSDFLAMAMIRGLTQAGLRLPDDMAVVGVDGTEIGAYYNPPLTSIAQDRHGLVNAAIDLLLKMQDKQITEPQHVIFPTKLIIRESA